MKLFTAICVMMSAAMLAAEPVAEKVQRGYHQSSKSYGKHEYISLRNDLAAYLVYLQWVNPSAKKEGKVTIGIPEPVFWQQFVNRDFMTLTINGINSTSLEPKEVKIFQEKDKAGVDILYNFDGVRMTLRFYMTSDSGLLIGEWIKDPSSEEAIEKAELSISAYPSYSVPNGGNKSDKYRRTIATTARTIKVHKGTAWKALTAKDTGMALYDEAFEPANTPKAHGPCFLAINWNGIKSGKVWFGQIYCMNFKFQLDSTAGKWQFGIWEFKKPMNNQEFFDLLKTKGAQFALPGEKAPVINVQ